MGAAATAAAAAAAAAGSDPSLSSLKKCHCTNSKTSTKLLTGRPGRALALTAALLVAEEAAVEAANSAEETLMIKTMNIWWKKL